MVPYGETALCIYKINGVTYNGSAPHHLCLSGLTNTFQEITSGDGLIEVIVIHFTTLGAHLFFNTPLYELYGPVVELDETGDVELTELKDRLMEESTPGKYWALINEFFLKRLAQQDMNSKKFLLMNEAIVKIRRNKVYQVKDLGDQLNISTRYLSQLFRSYTGFSVKDMIRLDRFHTALNILKNNHKGMPLQQIAEICRYHDLSHMSSDFIKIAGYNPPITAAKSKNFNDDIGWRL